MKANYLIRFDDICPTMNWTVWDEIEEILYAEKIRPILAVIPDNKDNKLIFTKPYKEFWNRVRSWQDSGWGIALHGYQHLYSTTNAGLMGINKRSEFAGLSYQIQEYKIKKALEVFENEGVNCNLWIAPAHSFDRNTIKVLSKAGIQNISDGFALFPYFKYNMFWIPQQLWDFIPMHFGTWTVCYHHNNWKPRDIRQFRFHLKEYKDAITCIDNICKLYGSRQYQWWDSYLYNIYFYYKRIRLKIRSWIGSNEVFDV
ncbi:DUF2334 domain-containing protein [Sporomusa rhizae]|uniref:DUF2334 domain-containing protein n=1 Tax=Sporomusa rhizae TaxID=357999 RepID=UPI00352A86A2